MLIKLILVPPNIPVCNFQAFIHFRVLMPFFVVFMYERLNNSLENHSQCLDSSQVFQIRLGIFFFLFFIKAHAGKMFSHFGSLDQSCINY